MLSTCEQIWINARLATCSYEQSRPYGALEPAVIGVKNGYIQTITTQQAFEQLYPQLDNSIYINDVQGAWITPGLIDAHTHLVFAGSRAHEFEQRLLGVSYTQIADQGGGILSTVRATREASIEDLVKLALPRLKALIAEGVTIIEIKSGYGLNLEAELKMLRATKRLGELLPIHVHTTLLAAHALPPEYQNRADDYIDWIIAELLPTAYEADLIDAVDIFCETIGFNPAQTERLFKAVQHYPDLGMHIHAEQLSNQQGAALAARYNAWSADHLEWLDEAGIQAMAQSGTVATLLPLAFYFLRDTKLPPIELLRRYQVPMVIATDFNPGTAPLASLRLAMNMACTLFRLTPEEALLGVTRHAAQALGVGNSLGQLREGFRADFIVWDIQHPAELAYQVGINPIQQRVMGGRITHV